MKKSRIFLIALLVLLLVVIYFIWRNHENKKWEELGPEYAGRVFVYSQACGDTSEMRCWVVDELKEKVKRLKYDWGFYGFSELYEFSDLMLVNFKRKEILAVGVYKFLGSDTLFPVILVSDKPHWKVYKFDESINFIEEELKRSEKEVEEIEKSGKDFFKEMEVKWNREFELLVQTMDIRIKQEREWAEEEYERMIKETFMAKER